jgi:hypothetical protein
VEYCEDEVEATEGVADGGTSEKSGCAGCTWLSPESELTLSRIRSSLSLRSCSGRMVLLDTRAGAGDEEDGDEDKRSEATGVLRETGKSLDDLSSCIT